MFLRPWRFALRCVPVSLWVLGGLATEMLMFPLLGDARQRQVVRLWSHGLLVLCGIRVEVLGQPVRDGPVLWVANHVSWIDIFVINRVRTTAFVAKSDIRRWPIIGQLVARAGTLFIDRRQKQAVREASRRMQDCLAQARGVGLFPEGTTTEGLDVRPFHSGLFDAAIHAAVDVQPVALRLLQDGVRAPHLAFVGDQTLVANLWWLLGARAVVVECEFLPPIACAPGLTRSDLARQSHAAIREVVCTATSALVASPVVRTPDSRCSPAE